MLHFHIYAKADELDLLEKQLDSKDLLCIKSESLIVTESTDETISIIADFIVKNLYKNYIQNNLSTKYSYFNAEEREIILNQVLFSIEPEKTEQALKKIHFGINLHSFVMFMMNDELNNIDFEIDRAGEIMHAKREYYDYIRLLRYYAEMHDSGYDTVNLMFAKLGFEILDENYKAFTNADVSSEIAMIDEDDALVATLIEMSPKKIVVHGAEFADDTMLDTIVNVFGDKIYMCDGCSHCIRK